MVKERDPGSLVGVEKAYLLGAGKKARRRLGGAARRNYLFRTEKIRLIAIHPGIDRVGKARLARYALLRNERGKPILIGKAEPATRSVIERLTGGERGILDLLQGIVEVAY